MHASPEEVSSLFPLVSLPLFIFGACEGVRERMRERGSSYSLRLWVRLAQRCSHLVLSEGVSYTVDSQMRHYGRVDSQLRHYGLRVAPRAAREPRGLGGDAPQL